MAIRERDQQALKWAGVAVVLFLLFRFGVFPVWDRWQEGRANLPLREKTLLKYRNAVATAALRGSEAARWETALREAEAGLLTGGTTAVASAELQQWIKDAAARQAIEIRSSEFLPAKPFGEDYFEVPLRVQFQCRLDSLGDFLRELQSGSKAVVVTRWGIVATGNPEKSLNVNLTISGIVRHPEKQE